MEAKQSPKDASLIKIWVDKGSEFYNNLFKNV